MNHRCFQCQDRECEGGYSICRECLRESWREINRLNRQRVFDHYGRACACCGSTENLEIDHIFGGGNMHVQSLGSSKAGHGDSTILYRWLVANDFPVGFQTLCSRCNQSKGASSRCRLHMAALRRVV